MAVEGTWEAGKMLEVYIYDFLRKRNLVESAKAFLSETNVSSDLIAIDAPEGFLLEWWSVFWDLFYAHSGQKKSETAVSYLEAQQMKMKEQNLQLLQRQQRQWLQSQQLQQGMKVGGLTGVRKPTTLLADAAFGANNNGVRQRETIGSAFMNGPLLHSGVMGVQAKNDITSMSNLGPNHGSVFGVSIPAAAADQTTLPGNLLSSPGLLNQHGSLGDHPSLMQMPSKGNSVWPTSSQGLRRQMMSNQSLKSFGQNSSQQLYNYGQMQQGLMPQMKQQMYAGLQDQNQAAGAQTQRMSMMGRIALSNSNGRDAMQTSGGSDFSQGAVSSPSISQGSQGKVSRKMNLIMQQQQQQQQAHSGGGGTTTLQREQQLQQDRLSGVGATSQNGRKRKPSEPVTSSQGQANSLGTVNTTNTGATPSPNSVPSSQDQSGMSMAQQQLQSQLAITSPGTIVNQMDFRTMSGEDGNGADPNGDSYGLSTILDHGSATISKQSNSLATATVALNPTPRFSFSEVGCLRASTSKVLCCDFSLDGNLLASAGHDKKVNLWKVDTLKLEHTLEEHSLLITDVRFSPVSNRLATSSFDKTVKVWEGGNPTYSMITFQGHATSVMSLDFHPNNEDLLCSCDGDSEIRYWSVSQGICVKIFKGGMAQLRFQPRIGRFLAAAAANVVTIFDVEAESDVHCALNHSKPVHSLCWSTSGSCLASLTEDYVRIWEIRPSNIQDGNDQRSKCIHEFSCNGKKFHSCVFHPNYPTVLVIGCYQSIELWNMVDNKSMTIAAHEGLISALVSCPSSAVVASASHDKCVKLWQ